MRRQLTGSLAASGRAAASRPRRARKHEGVLPWLNQIRQSEIDRRPPQLIDSNEVRLRLAYSRSTAGALIRSGVISNVDSNRFSAAGSALGYLAQVECALLDALRRMDTDVALRLSIETVDDITFDVEGQPLNCGRPNTTSIGVAR